MVIDAYALRLVQGADGDLNTIGKHCFAPAHRASARRAKATLPQKPKTGSGSVHR